VEALSASQSGCQVAGGGSCWRHGPLNSTTATLLDILLEAWRQRQPVNQVETNAAQDGELAEMTERVHTA